MKKAVIMIFSALLLSTVGWAKEFETIKREQLPKQCNKLVSRFDWHANIAYGFSRNGYWEYGYDFGQWIRVYRGDQKESVVQKIVEPLLQNENNNVYINRYHRDSAIPRRSVVGILTQEGKRPVAYHIAVMDGYTIVVRRLFPDKFTDFTSVLRASNGEWRLFFESDYLSLAGNLKECTTGLMQQQDKPFKVGEILDGWVESLLQKPEVW